MSRLEVERSRLMLAIILNYFLWGLGSLILRRSRTDLFAVLLHIYIYFLFFMLIEFWWIWFPIAVLGGAYFALDLGRIFEPRQEHQLSK